MKSELAPNQPVSPPVVPSGMNTDHYRQLLQQCVHCGMCLESCPTYTLFGTEMDSPRGRIALMKAASDGRIDRASFKTVFREHITLCLECRACETACPSGVQYGKLVEEARIAVEKESPPAWLEGQLKNFGLTRLMPDLPVFKRFSRFLHFYQHIGLERLVRKVNLLPWRLQEMAELLPPISQSDLQPGQIYPAQGEKRGTVAFFTGCVQEAFLGRINAATVRVLQRNGFEVHIPSQQTCCGAAQWHTGDKTFACQLAHQNIDAFLAEDYDAVINNAGGCGLTLQEYPDLLHDDPEYLEKAQQFSAKVQDFSQFLLDNLLEPPSARLAVRAVYSDSCHLRHGQQVIDAPRALLKSIPGLELAELNAPDRCCGSAGIYNMLIPEPANALLEAKIADIASTQARLVVTSNTGCHMQLVMGARRSGLDLHVMHIAEVLDHAYRAETRWLDNLQKVTRPLRKPRSAPVRWLGWLENRRKEKGHSPKLDGLRAQLQPGQLLENKVELLTYERDASNDSGCADGVVFPYNSEDVSKILSWCSQTTTPVIARGAGSGLAGNSVAEQGGLLLTFSQMKSVQELDQNALTVTVQPGMITQALDDLVLPLGLTYPPDPASGKASTLGANISLNSGGPHCFKYGVTSNYVLGIQVVLANGQKVSLGGKALDLPEYDLTGLFTGSEGTLGVITEATLALKHRFPAVKTMLAAFDSLEQAGEAVSAIIARGLIPATLELMDQRMMRAVEEFAHAGLPVDAAAALILETDGYPQSVDPQMDEIITVLNECGVQRMQIAEDSAQRDRIWYARKSSAGAIARMAPAEYTVDATVPRSKMAQAIREISRICNEAELVICIVAHAGDGNLHPMILIPDPEDTELMERIHQTGAAICDYCVKIEGSITGEHGVGIEKRDFMPFMYTHEELTAMQEIKEIFDPQNLLNAGKVFPKTMPPKSPAGISDARISSNPLTPGSTLEAADAIRQLKQQKRPVRIHSRAHNEVGDERTHFLSTSNLSGILDYQPNDLYLTVGAGSTLQSIQETLAEDNMWLPMISPWKESSLGGLVSSNLNAPLRMRYGSLRDVVLGMKVVLPDGRILRLGRPVVKNVAGYDLAKLFIGAYGTLGLITELTLKIMPVPRFQVSYKLPVERLESGLEMSRILLSKLTPSAVLLTGRIAMDEQQCSYNLVYTMEGYPQDVQEEDQAVQALLAKAGLAHKPETLPQSGSLVWADWLGSISERNKVYRVGLPANQLPDLLHNWKDELAHGSWMADLYSGLLYTRFNESRSDLLQTVNERDGYAVMISGNEESHTREERWIFQPDSLEMMQKIKTHWDPDHLFNPGAFLV